MSPLAVPAPTFLTAPTTSAIITATDLFPRESSAPAVATFICSPSVAPHDVVTRILLVVLIVLVVLLLLLVLYIGCRNRRQRGRVMMEVDVESLSSSDRAYDRRSIFTLGRFPEPLEAPTTIPSAPPRFSLRSTFGTEVGTEIPLTPLRRPPSQARLPYKWIKPPSGISTPPPIYTPRSCESSETQAATRSEYADIVSLRAGSGEK
ncbi:hypothetical protein C8Q72DRAFT_116265 [Fomitopsis betulina]|nr:hypothetical protein C8Q72DRAFT_116265 [Fomitopsis betulina]